MKRKVKISQCMIVKNEEKNIRRALTWAKDIVFEQIVVDTGSTDRTVEIAKEMGAKVYHFQWIDDFAAAKNYAIEQASGEWIAFLDADEYMNKEDTRKLVRLLEQIPIPKKGEKVPLFIRCAWVQLEDSGKPFSVDYQDRVFRNRKDLRYHGKIHEQIQMPPSTHFTFIRAENMLSIFHTGYGKSAYKETGKLQRNIELLERELEQDPDNYMAWSYLGDSQKEFGDQDGAKVSYQKALAGKDSGRLTRQRYQDSRTGLMAVLAERADQEESAEEIIWWAEDYGYPNTDNPDPWLFLGLWHYNRKEMEEAREQFLTCLKKLETYCGYDKVAAEGVLRCIYTWLAQACLQLKRPQEVVRYCVLSLRMERYQDKVLTSVFQLLRQEPGESDHADGTWKFLQNLYDFQNSKDLLFILKCAKLSGFEILANRVIESLPDDLRKEFQRTSEENTFFDQNSSLAMSEEVEGDTVMEDRETGRTTRSKRKITRTDIHVYAHSEKQLYDLISMMEGMIDGRIVADDIECASLCRQAVCVAMDRKMPQAESWLVWTEERYASSIFFRVDVAASATVYYCNKKEYEKALNWYARYQKGVDDYYNDRFDTNELQCSGLNGTEPDAEQHVKTAAAYSLTMLGRDGEGIEVLRSFDPLVTGGQVLDSYLRILQKIEESEENSAGAQVLCAQIVESVLVANPEDKHARENLRTCMGAAALLFKNQGKKGWRVFRQVPGELGYAAQAMDERNPALITEQLSMIQNWKDIPPAVILHAVLCHASLPEAFFQNGVESMQNAVAVMAQDDMDFAFHMAEGDMQIADSLTKLQFQYELTSWALQLLGPLRAADERELCQKLCTRLVDLTGALLPRLYSSSVLEHTENWKVLPAAYRFGLWMRAAKQARSAGDHLEYVRALRRGLDQMPAMKEMVDFLIKELKQGEKSAPETMKATPEMLQLAGQIRAILSQYTPDDPAILTLKASPAYQKVEALLELSEDLRTV